MFREFNVKFEDVEMLGGADNLLEGTEITKVIVRGDNNKMSSLDSMLKNCNELDTVEGELDLNGVSDIDNLLEGTELVKSINLKNINNENISANNSFPHVDQINIGGELYNKKAMQNVIASKDWTFDSINYQGTVSDNIVEKEVNIVDDNKTTIQDTLEQKAKGIEIIGQTYENLVVGSGEATLLDELTLESIDGSPKEFNPHLEQPVCVETIEGETYQNLIEGKGEYKLTDTFSTTWTESNNSIENPPSMIEIPEIWGNTVQGYANVVTEKMIYDSITNSSVTTKVIMNSDNSLKISNWGDLNSWIPTDEDMEKHSIKLKPNTTYSMCAWRKETGERLGSLARVESDGLKGDHNSSYKFTTDNTGRVFLCPYGYVYNFVVRVYEGDIPNIADLYEFDLNYIESVGDLYVDEEGSPILDEEGNEQYKLEIESYSDGNIFLNDGLLDFQSNSNWDVEKNGANSFRLSQKIRQSYLSSKPILLHKGEYTFTYNHTKIQGSYSGCDDFKVYLNNVTPSSTSSNVWKFTIDKPTSFYFSIRNYAEASATNICITDYTFNLVRGDYNDYINIKSQSNKTTILMPCQLMKIGGYMDKLYWDKNSNSYLIEKQIDCIDSDIVKNGANSVSYHPNYAEGLANDGNKVIQLAYRNPDLFKSIDIIPVYSTILPATTTFYDSHNAEGCYTRYDYELRVSIKNYKLGLDFSEAPSVRTVLEKMKSWLGERPTTFYYAKNTPEIIETKILEKPSLETYSPKTYISTNAEVQPSQMSIVNKQTILSPLSLQANTDYTLQLDSVGKDSKNITVNLGGTETTIQPTNDTKKHHKVVVRTPAALTNDTLELSGEGVIVNDVMLFQGGSNDIKQEVEYIDGIESIGELVENLFPIDVIENIKTNYDEYKNNYYKKEIQLQPNTTYSVRYLGKGRGYGYGLIIGGKENITGSHSWLCDMNLNSGITTKTFTTDSTGKLTFGISFIGIDSISSFLRQETKVQIEIGNNVSSEYFEGERYKIDISSHSDNDFDFDSYSASSTVDKIENKFVFNNGSMRDHLLYIDGFGVVKPNEIVYVNIKVETKNITGRGRFRVGLGDKSAGWYNFYSLFQEVDTSNPNSMYELKGILKNTSTKDLYLYLCGSSNGNVGGSVVFSDIYVSRSKQLDTYVRYGNCKKSILLPQPLNKIGEIKDKFYWDDNKGHYCIEQNVEDYIITKDSPFIYRGYRSLNVYAVLDKEALGYDLTNKISLLGIKQYNQFPYQADELGYYINNETGEIEFVIHKLKVTNSLEGILSKLFEVQEEFNFMYGKTAPNIIDLPHLNKKYSLDTYMPTTHLECTNSPMQPSRILLESDTVRYKPSALETDTDYTVQFECKEKSDKKVKLNLGGTEKEVDAEVGLNHVSITTPSEIDVNTYKDRLFLSGVGNKVDNVMVIKGEMNQYPEYFDGVANASVLQGGKYKIDIKTNEGFTLSIKSTKPLEKGDKLYWNKSNKRYEINRNGVIEVPVVEGNVIDLPRLYQREDTNLTIESGNIKPAKTKIVYKDII